MEALLDFTYQLKEKKLQVPYFPKGTYPIRVNKMIGNGFLTLTSNAIKYRPNESRIELDIQDQDNMWVVSVRALEKASTRKRKKSSSLDLNG